MAPSNDLERSPLLAKADQTSGAIRAGEGLNRSPSHARVESVDTQIVDSLKSFPARDTKGNHKQRTFLDFLSCFIPWKDLSLFGCTADALIVFFLVSGYSLLVTLGPLLLAFQGRQRWCPYDSEEDASDAAAAAYANPDYRTDPCRYLRTPWLLGLTLEDCDISQRLLVSVVLGGLIGYERRSADRPAGIRTMCLVSLGGCFFTISSILAFKSSTMGWDSSRVTAALPSGVGFLGGALIWKGTVVADAENSVKHQVHGLTTAASLWLSAAIGVGAGGAMYAVTLYATALVLFMLRYGPKLYRQEEDSDDGTEEEDEAEEWSPLLARGTESSASLRKVVFEEDFQTIDVSLEPRAMERDESQSSSLRRSSVRRRSTVRRSMVPTFGS